MLRQEAPDLKETLEIGKEGQEEWTKGWPVVEKHGGNGQGVARGFRETMVGFFEECKSVHVQLMRAIAVGMWLDEKWLNSYKVPFPKALICLEHRVRLKFCSVIGKYDLYLS